ncbi:Uncharacterized protein APZ42_003581 [Daphnia magna]|uniref:Uncharacterized protein n=1 Tax=Daphnia magna TaxID=35525 RepID=A0A164HGD0_9CRUS|nr:Uncharacterized protein APZ42_003581 [Daphnia magna]
MSRAAIRETISTLNHILFLFFSFFSLKCFVLFFFPPRVCACNLLSLVVVRLNNPRRRNMKETVMFYKFFFFSCIRSGFLLQLSTNVAITSVGWP